MVSIVEGREGEVTPPPYLTIWVIEYLINDLS